MLSQESEELFEKARDRLRDLGLNPAARAGIRELSCMIAQAHGHEKMRWRRPEARAIIRKFVEDGSFEPPLRAPEDHPRPYKSRRQKKRTQSRRQGSGRRFATTTKFLQSWEWTELRYRALKLHGRRCQCCGATPADGVMLHVDHIKPRSKFPELALEIDNLQVLCAACNKGKGAWDETDFRIEN